MTDAPPDLQQAVQTLREDERLADQYHGALEIMAERIKTDAILNTAFADCVKFHRTVKQLLLRLDRLAAGEAPSAGLDPKRIQGLIDEWQEARGPFRQGYRDNKDYLEKLAKRFLP